MFIVQNGYIISITKKACPLENIAGCEEYNDDNSCFKCISPTILSFDTIGCINDYITYCDSYDNLNKCLSCTGPFN